MLRPTILLCAITPSLFACASTGGPNTCTIAPPSTYVGNRNNAAEASALLSKLGMSGNISGGGSVAETAEQTFNKVPDEQVACQLLLQTVACLTTSGKQEAGQELFKILAAKGTCTVPTSTAALDRGMNFSSSGRKLCSVYVPGIWRDSIAMPDSANEVVCIDFMRSVQANTYQLGCINPESGTIRLGANNGGRPNPNCGW